MICHFMDLRGLTDQKFHLRKQQPNQQQFQQQHHGSLHQKLQKLQQPGQQLVVQR